MLTITVSLRTNKCLSKTIERKCSFKTNSLQIQFATLYLET